MIDTSREFDEYTHFDPPRRAEERGDDRRHEAQNAYAAGQVLDAIALALLAIAAELEAFRLEWGRS